MLVVELKSQPAGPPTVWLAYDVVGGVCAEAVTAIRSTVMARFVAVAVAIVAAEAMRTTFLLGLKLKLGLKMNLNTRSRIWETLGRGCDGSRLLGCGTRGLVV